MNLAHAIWDLVEFRDHQVMHRVHRWRAPRWIRLWMVCATLSGDGWIWYALASIIAVFGDERRWRVVGASTLAVAFGILLFLFAKRMVRRPRPCQLEPHCWATLLPPDQFSFPSGHTITAFAATVPVCAVYPDLTVPLGFLALSIAASRVVLGMHFLSDVLAGAILGSALGLKALDLLV